MNRSRPYRYATAACREIAGVFCLVQAGQIVRASWTPREGSSWYWAEGIGNWTIDEWHDRRKLIAA